MFLMNITRDDKKLLEKAVSFVLSDQYRGSSPARENLTKKFAAAGLEKIKSSSPLISFNELVALSDALLAYAEMLDKSPLCTDTKANEPAHLLSDKFYTAALALDALRHK
jgi:hypothetical protein